MAARFLRTPRLTLFSGPNCSLCDVAKAELAKVRQQRAFQLETVNIQAEGQERWKRKYVYWIPALHLEGKEIAKGRWDAQTVVRALQEWDQQQLQEPLYFTDTSGVINPWHESYIYGIYQRDTNVILGEEESDKGNDEPEPFNHCFNCGSPDHSVPACPFWRNKELISLSRQYYNFYKELRGIVDQPRIYLAEGWRQQRLEWLDTFRPGHIQNPLLQEAIGFGNGDWLKNIAVWGYPPGWISVRDPREKARLRIWDEHLDSGYERSGDPFHIFGDTDEPEDVSENILAKTEHDSKDHPADLEDQKSSDNASEPIRWAVYPSTYFSPDLLFAYTRQEAPPSSSIEWNAAFDGEDDYFYQLYGQPPPPPEDPPPIPPPPPPPSSPPPIPPPPLLSPPPSPPEVTHLKVNANAMTAPLPIASPPERVNTPPNERGYVSVLAQECEEDMDISDSE